MDWDYTFFIPDNNPFRKQWVASDKEETAISIVTEVNRCFQCVSCQRQIGDVASIFYEIDAKFYCSKCGFEVFDAKQKSSPSQKIRASIETTL